MKAIINATLVMRDHFVPNAVLLIKDGKIADFGKARDVKIPDGAEIIDAKGNIIMPGFVNTHCHLAMTLFRGYAENSNFTNCFYVANPHNHF